MSIKSVQQMYCHVLAKYIYICHCWHVSFTHYMHTAFISWSIYQLYSLYFSNQLRVLLVFLQQSDCGRTCRKIVKSICC